MFDSLSHHAYGLAGNAETVLGRLIASLEKLKVTTKGNPDFRLESYETMGIDEARALSEAAQLSPVGGGKKVFIISARGITSQAQNALLKLFEEPPSDTHFFLLVPSAELLLQTLRSRLYMVRPDSHAAGEDSAAAGFLADTIPARLAAVQAMLKELEQEKKKKEGSTEPLLEKERIMQFLDALEKSAAKDTKGNAQALFAILEAKKYSRDRAPSFKLLLEHLALVLPKI